MNRKTGFFNTLSNKPFVVVAMTLSLYAAWFVLPFLLNRPDAATLEAPLVGLDKVLGMFSEELIVTLVLVVFLSAIGWWRKTGFQRIEKGGLKFLVPPILFALVLHQVLTLMAPEDHGLFGFISAQQFFIAVVTVLLLGFNEEMVFRGITYYGFSTRVHPIQAVIIAAVIFGLFHYVNMLGEGQSFVPTTYQVLHAMAAGFMYGALRLIVGSIWPVMIFHGFWDLNLFSMDTVNNLGKTVQTTSAGDLPVSGTLALIYVLPAFLYGLFVCWRWSVRNRQASVSRM